MTRVVAARRKAAETAVEPRHLIVIGAARSGTKLLRDALAAAMGVGKVPYDIGYVWRYGNEDTPDDVIDPSAMNDRTRRFICKYIDAYASGQPPAVIEKTVGNTLRVPAVASVFPNAAYIHLVRDGVDVIESSMRQWNAPANMHYLGKKARQFPIRLVAKYGVKYVRSLAIRRIGHDSRLGTWGVRYPGIDLDLGDQDLTTVCARQWCESVSRARSGLEVSSVSYTETRYETLIEDPAAEVSRLVTFAKAPIDRESLLAACQNIARGRSGTGRAALSATELATIDVEAGDLLDQLGYERPKALR